MDNVSMDYFRRKIWNTLSILSESIGRKKTTKFLKDLMKEMNAPRVQKEKQEEESNENK